MIPNVNCLKQFVDNSNNNVTHLCIEENAPSMYWYMRVWQTYSLNIVMLQKIVLSNPISVKQFLRCPIWHFDMVIHIYLLLLIYDFYFMIRFLF